MTYTDQDVEQYRTADAREQEQRIWTTEGVTAEVLMELLFCESCRDIGPDGYTHLRLFAHSRAKWLSVEVERGYQGKRATVRRRVVVTLQARQLREMHAFLGKLLAGGSED